MFIDWYAGLATGDETPLIVQQKISSDNNKTWTAYLPHRYHPSWVSAYGNTGAFRVDRFERGRPAAKASNCD